jgi:2'-5' RNA ligase
LRAFIAVELSSTDAVEKLQQDLVAETKWLSGHFMPVRSQKLHFTLIFLGNVGLETSDRVQMILSDIKFKPLNLVLRGIGAFPHPGHARVIWVGVDENGKRAMVNLAQQIVSGLSRIKISPDRPFEPHLTIFRAKVMPLQLRPEVISKYYDKAIAHDTIDRVHFKRSELTSSGPTYTNIFTVHAT